ncbi:hypothetical protein NEPAR06_1683 [Nematocida parisii]|uniref:Uncharacterized protein n=1 Tax=Nematocida parisii (strain ERTm3) TaxID=935791 RepID=I3EKJ4_NEMP3|nr:uncharacterized protein NEPG_00722 [Nematocida parisii ERTm1]EIJ89741.1 hypothetical protein NEQG_00511 [Nematocida parisii ERTm3]KAI5145430.1 hypothetical protein NEPAR07_1681 [Nematocida parisii]EIJ94056.1 hypothetical protein NEPG_00722 [Nematocida parisii ERTm1]KAI5155264.1 hypothetical protein NEPAR06_1683 [Nematocida parisii]KAI5157982.1 hypothetical protein NEPAR05_1759 [Nematocida parisii]|eukprot:XP_013058552.1 hypothetical protein NEPG_00722 [Nematocida parisii ERTm1]
MKNILRTRIVTLGVCSFILFSIIPRIDLKNIDRINVFSILCLAYWIGTKYYKSATILYFILNSSDVVFMLESGRMVLFYSLVYFSEAPVLSDLSYGRSICRSIRTKNLFPLAVSVIAGVSLAIWRVAISESGSISESTPLRSSESIHMQSQKVYLSSMDSHSIRNNENFGDNGTVVFGTKKVSEQTEWKIVLEGLEGNPPPPAVITSGSVVYLQNLYTKEYLYVFCLPSSGVASGKQKILSTLQITDLNQFIILNTVEDTSKTAPIYRDGSFYLKHVSSGVFVRVCKKVTQKDLKHLVDAYEICGEALEAKKSIMDKRFLWSGRKNAGHKEAFTRKITRILLKTYKEELKKIKSLFSINEAAKKERETFEQIRAGLYNNYNLVVYLALFMVSAVRGLLGMEVIWEQVMSCLIDILLCLIFKKTNTKEIVYASSVVGIQHGLKLHKLISEILSKTRSKLKKQ